MFITSLIQLSTEYVLRRFNNEGCPELKGKPKFIILQACRGDDVDYGTRIPTLESQDSVTCQVDAQGFKMSSNGIPTTSLLKDPTWEDMVCNGKYSTPILNSPPII